MLQLVAAQGLCGTLRWAAHAHAAAGASRDPAAGLDVRKVQFRAATPRFTTPPTDE